MTPIELGPIPDPEFPEGSQIGSAEGSSTSYERAAGELLHRPHAFALMHGDGGAKVAFGQLQWRIDTITLEFKTSTGSGVSVTVDDHPDHSHAPHANHSHSDHTDHSHADHTDHPSHTHGYSHTHTVGVASHDHDHDHTHELNHVHDTDTGGPTTTGTTGGSGYTSLEEHSHTISQHSHTTVSIDDATTDSINNVTTGNVNSGSSTTTTLSQNNTVTEGPNAALTHSSHSGVKDVSDGSASAPAGVLEHSNAVNTDGSAIDSTDAAGVLKHSGVKATNGTSSAPTGVLQHNVTVSGGLNTITYCSGAAQDPISDINVQIPKVDAEDGPAMEATLHGQGQDDPYHQLSSYGDVYLVWIVNLENAGTEVEKCWVQVGEPTGDQISDIGMGTSTTNRRTVTDPSLGTGLGEGEDKGVFKMKLGTVNEDSQIVQNITSDVVWTTTVMDRLFA